MTNVRIGTDARMVLFDPGRDPYDLDRDRDGIRLPSMGPPPFGDGNLDRLTVADGAELAPLMGPPPFGDGNNANVDQAFKKAYELQWGHRLSAMETSVGPVLPF